MTRAETGRKRRASSSSAVGLEGGAAQHRAREKGSVCSDSALDARGGQREGQ